MQNLSRRLFLKRTSLGFAAMALTSCMSPAHAPAKKPNLLYINIDDLGWSDLSFMESPYYDTPNIDRLAKEGVVFSQAYAPAANCAPSRACCMSGQYTPRHGIYTVNHSDRGPARHRKLIPVKNTTVLPDKTITMAEALKAGGYATCFIGKWHLGQDPCTQGFDHNIAGSHNGHPKSYFSPYQNKYLTDGPKGQYLTDRLTDEAMRFLDQRDTDKPFFMYLAFYTVHTPLQAKKETIQRYQQKKGNPQHNNPKYAAMIKHLDDNIGWLLKKLEASGLRDNTLVLFTSDNGGLYSVSRQWPLRAGKGSYYEGGIRVPMVVYWPGRTTAGQTCDVPVSGIDFYPTFLEVAGLTKPEGIVLDGVSLMPLITGRGTIHDRPLFWHFPIYLQGGNTETQDTIFRTRPGSAVRYGDWKLIEYFEKSELELYNLNKDVGERQNLAAQRPQKTNELLTMLRAWRKQTNAPVPTKANPQYEPAP